MFLLRPPSLRERRPRTKQTRRTWAHAEVLYWILFRRRRPPAVFYDCTAIMSFPRRFHGLYITSRACAVLGPPRLRLLLLLLRVLPSANAFRSRPWMGVILWVCPRSSVLLGLAVLFRYIFFVAYGEGNTLCWGGWPAMLRLIIVVLAVDHGWWLITVDHPGLRPATFCFGTFKFYLLFSCNDGQRFCFLFK